MTKKLTTAVCLLGVFFLLAMAPKKKNFLDHFESYTYDTLTVGNHLFDAVYNPSSPFEVRGNLIDTVFNSYYTQEGAEDLRVYNVSGTEKGLLAYQKIKLDLGYYLLIIRAGGEYWNSRKYACLYNSGSKKITDAQLLSEDVREKTIFTCTSLLKKENNTWSIYTKELFYEPLAGVLHKDSMQVREVDILVNIESNEEHFFFVEKARHQVIK